jgi:hypothetical protein
MCYRLTIYWAMPWSKGLLHSLWSNMKYSLDLMYLWSKVVCFVLFCWSCSDLPKPLCFMPHSWCLWKALDESSWLHPLGLRLFGATMWKLLIIESFSQWKLNKIETENCIGICRHSWSWKWFRKAPKASDLIDLMEFISQSWELRCKRYWFLIDFFFVENSNKLQKIGFGRKNQLSSQCVHIVEFKKL